MVHIIQKLVVILLFLSGSCLATVFTYQGHLRNAGDLVIGPMDFKFALWNAETNGGQISAVLPLNAVEIANGLFRAPNKMA